MAMDASGMIDYIACIIPKLVNAMYVWRIPSNLEYQGEVASHAHKV